jgi:hypothetical protein
MKSLAVLVIALAAACGTTHDTAPTAQPTTKLQAMSSTADDQALCVEGFQHARTCTDQYIPALVDARAKVDHPPGIAAEVAKDRDAVIAKAMQEWAKDSTDDAIAANCQQIVARGAMDPSTMDTAKGCMAQTDCAAFTACILPIVGKHL